MLTTNKRRVLHHFKTLVNNSRCFCSSSTKGPVQYHSSSESEDSDSLLYRDRINVKKCKTFDARKLGITGSMISQPSQYVLKKLQDNGFKSYLVGGCVRDLILNRTPKDFDVVTTAKLMQARKQFRRSGRRADVVGRRFPVCLVHIKGSIVEVTSFETESQTTKGMRKVLHSLLPKCSNKEDQFLYKSTLRRDFTINSLFYDPFANKIYDYANGIADLRSLKLETVTPAQLSFKDDPGRILRGFRIAARLGLSLSRETEDAIWTCSSLVKDLNKDRVMIELNYMLSYGAAEPSLRLLWKFKLLQFLLPVHAAYLDEQATKEDGQASNMLMKLFFHLDNLVGCDRPSDCTLWIGLLAFHLALVNNPQDALVVWVFASVLYHGEWEKGIKFANEHAKMCVNFAPEIKTSSIGKSDEEIAEAVTKLASLAIDSIHALANNDCLSQSQSRYPSVPRSHMVFVSKKTEKAVSEIFEVLVDDIKFYKSDRKSEKINYNMLGSGHSSENRFVLGKIVLETMRSGIVGDRDGSEAEKCHLKTEGTKDFDQLAARKDKIKVLPTPNLEHRQEKLKKQKLAENTCIAEQKTGLDEFPSYKETNEEHQKPDKLRQEVDLSMKNSMPNNKSSHSKQLMNDKKKIASANKSSTEHARHLKTNKHCVSSQSTASKKYQVIANSHNKKVGVATDKSVDRAVDDNGRQQPQKSKKSLSPLSSLFNSDESVDKVVNDNGRQQPPKSKKSLSPLSSLFNLSKKRRR
ncbi:tRNA nucleotidyltransferase/poly(A) polymerase [Trifolium pratense]|uniref:tRNA nucleotidyltransferase/poly(A) polymerase n=2 Tax=Trifolium TaxID=3898 RepID=A0A2K3P1N7_TRIPR|nr:tRNA nucleotidyltransferase/poly(A) polymerase [Trifolium pratense]